MIPFWVCMGNACQKSRGASALSAGEGCHEEQLVAGWGGAWENSRMNGNLIWTSLCMRILYILYLHLCLEDVERACSSPVFLCICHLWISWLWCPPFILAEFVSPWFVRTKSGSADHHRQNDTTPSSFSVWSFEISSTTFLSWSVNGQHLHLGVIKTLLASLSFGRKSCWGTVSQVRETWHTYSTYLVDPSTYTS